MNLVKLLFIFLALTAMLRARPYFQQEVHYKIDVTLHAQQNTYSGFEQVTYINHSPDTLHFMRFHLYPNAYRNNETPYARQEARFCRADFYFSKKNDRGYLELQNIKSQGQTLSYTYNGKAIDEIKVILAKPLAPGDSVTLSMNFIGKFPIVFSRMGHWGKYHYAATQWYPKVVVYDRFGWHPDSYLNQGEFYGEFGTFDVTITLPKSFVIDATGMLVNSPQEERFMQQLADTTAYFLKLDKGQRKAFIRRWVSSKKEQVNLQEMKTVRFHADHVHNFAWFAGYDYMVLRKVHNGGVLTNVLVQPQEAYAWRHVPEFAERTVAFYGKQVGPFRYPKASVVQGALKAGGGMEYPMITIISSPAVPGTHLLEMVVMHEIGHNWFMGMLGSDERRSTFLDEGMNSFLEMKYMEHYYGKYNLTDFKTLFHGWHVLNDIGEWQTMQFSYGTKVTMRDDQPLNLRAEAYSPSNYGAINYHKGALMLLALENYLTPEVFWKGMHAYYQKWCFKHPTVEDFFAVMSETSGQDLTQFYKDWYQSTTYCDFVVTHLKSKRQKGLWQTQVFVRNKGTMKNMPADVALVTVTGDTLIKRWPADSTKPVVFEHQAKARYAEVNPEQQIFETSYFNNRSGLPPFKLHLLIPQVPDLVHYEITVLPYYWYEPFVDHHRLGALVWGGNPIFNSWFWGGKAFYATSARKMGYAVFLSNRVYPDFANYADVKIEAADEDGLRRASLSVNNFILKPDNDCVRKSIRFRMDALDLYEPAYYQNAMFERVRYAVPMLEGAITKRTMLTDYRLTLRVHKGMELNGSKVNFWKYEAEARVSHRFSRDVSIGLHGYAGTIKGRHIPLQETIFALGDIDPRHQRFAFARRGKLAPGRFLVSGNGMDMYAYNQSNGSFFTGKSGAALNLDVRIWRFLPAFYASGAWLGANAFDWFSHKPFAEFGLKFSLFKTECILPLYVTDPAPGERHLALRLFCRLALDSAIKFW